MKRLVPFAIYLVATVVIALIAYGTGYNDGIAEDRIGYENHQDGNPLTIVEILFESRNIYKTKSDFKEGEKNESLDRRR
jgi:hypothetical protein